MILDDVFSGLDAISEDRIFSRLLGKSGLLRRLGTTAILVTHAAHRLSYADNIIALTNQGTISEQGKFGDLMAASGYVASLAARHISEDSDAPQEEAAIAKAKIGDDTARQNAADDIHRPIGNWTTYKYYFTSAGWRNVGIWTGLMICYSMLLQFPGTGFPFPVLTLANN